MDEVPGITDVEEEEPEAVAGPHSDVAGIAKPANSAMRPRDVRDEEERRRTTTTPSCTNTRPLFTCGEVRARRSTSHLCLPREKSLFRDDEGI